eukprot:631707-Prymnesium_polylepis.1
MGVLRGVQVLVVPTVRRADVGPPAPEDEARVVDRPVHAAADDAEGGVGLIEGVGLHQHPRGGLAVGVVALQREREPRATHRQHGGGDVDLVEDEASWKGLRRLGCAHDRVAPTRADADVLP